MRKFTKGLLMTFVAAAMSLSANAQVEGYFRVKNAGANKFGYNVVQVSSETTATLKCTAKQAITLPGTVMYLNAEPAEYTDEEVSPYIDRTDEDLLVVSLRSQGVDAQKSVYGSIVTTMREGFSQGLALLNDTYAWGFSTAKQKEIIESMFEYMKMYMTPTTTQDGTAAYYLKSTTPSTEPLVDALTEEQKAALGDVDLKQSLWKRMYNTAFNYYVENGYTDLAAAFQALMTRIHMGHTYYLSAGYVIIRDNAEAPQEFKYNENEPAIYFANNNTVDYPASGLVPEIDFIGDYSKWIVEPVVKNEDASYKGTDYFAVNPSYFMKGLNDGKFYTSLYTDYPMEIVGKGMRVWGIQGQPVVQDTKDGKVALVTTYEYTSTVPARQGVIVECTYNDNDGPAGNCLQPVLSPEEGPVGNTALTGLFFDTPINNGYITLDRWHNNQEIAVEQLRVFSKKEGIYDGGNPIGFYTFNGDIVSGNKAIFVLDNDLVEAQVMAVKFVGAGEYADGIAETVVATENNSNVYDIQGRLVSNPTKGLYIVNGKKMVIK